jgi:hypothetical protein
MTQENNEVNNVDPVISDDTKATLDYFKAQGNEIEEPSTETKTEPEPAKPEPVKEEVKQEEAKVETKDDETSKPNRTPKVMPVWQHEVEMKKIEKQHQQELEDARKTSENIKKQEDNQAPVAIDDKIKQVADEFGVDENVLAKIVDLAKPDIPQEFKEAVNELNAIKQERLAQQEELGFEKEFSAILPIIENEFGQLDSSQLSEIKTKLKDIAFQEQFAKTPLSVIFKGFDDFRNTKVIKRTMEQSRPASNTESDIDFSSMTDEDLQKADRETQAKYFEWSDKKNQKR